MPAAPQDFHYMTVLSELEKAVCQLQRDKQSTEHNQVALKHLVKKLYSRVTNLSTQWSSLEEKIAFELGAEQARQIKVEEQIVDHIEALTNDLHHRTPHRELAGDWPPIIPITRMVERFTALTIGLHSEAPEQDFKQHLVTAFRDAIIPGLAWGLMVRLYSRSPDTRGAMQTALGDHLRTGNPGAPLAVAGQGHARIDYLLLVDAWFKMLECQELGGISASALDLLRGELADLIQMKMGDLDTLLWERLGGQYLGLIAGSERARAVALAERHSAGSAAFLRERLSLFEAAQAKDGQRFRDLTETNLARALEQNFEVMTVNAGNIEAGEEACGAAFWLARATFGRHSSPQSPLAEKASIMTLRLLTRAGVMFKHKAVDSDRLLTCLRYAAGYATNPRYVRAATVLHMQELLVDLYEVHPRHRTALVALFRGRIAWQQWHATKRSDFRKSALRSYYTALQTQREANDGLDAEAPVHFFPELTTLLRQTSDNGSKTEKTLAAVDFITQRNYGVYFDINREQAFILAGLDSFKEYHDGKTSAARDGARAGSPQVDKITHEAIGEIKRALGFNR